VTCVYLFKPAQSSGPIETPKAAVSVSRQPFKSFIVRASGRVESQAARMIRIEPRMKRNELLIERENSSSFDAIKMTHVEKEAATALQSEIAARCVRVVCIEESIPLGLKPRASQDYEARG
jgi:hypothetical protein